MKATTILMGVLILSALYWLLQMTRTEGYKNVDTDAQTQLDKIKTKILPAKAICVRGAQCISGKCLETNNETTYGYCT